MSSSHAQGAHADPTFRSRPRATGEVVRRVGIYLRPYKLMVVGTVGCAVLSLVSGFIFPGMTHFFSANCSTACAFASTMRSSKM